MSWKSSPILVFLLLTSCLQRGSKLATHAFPSHNPLIELEELLANDFSKGYALVDFRHPQAYAEGHIKEAVNIWRSDIEDTTKPYKGIMPTKEQLEKVFSKKGIQPTDTLILYDDNGSCEATRLWWVLQHYGFKQTRVLNGGLKAYRERGLALSKEIPKRDRSRFVLKGEFPEHFIGRDELLNLLNTKTPLKLVDVRTPDEFHGKRQKKGAYKAGRISKSIYFDWKNALDSTNGHHFLPKEALQKRYQKLSPNKEDLVVVYCHSGVRSAHTTFVLTQLLGYKNIKNYDGSWTEWSYFDGLPYERDLETTIFE